MQHDFLSKSARALVSRKNPEIRVNSTGRSVGTDIIVPVVEVCRETVDVSAGYLRLKML